MDPQRAGWLLRHHSTRRVFVGVGFAAAATGLLAACGAPAPATAPPTSAPANAPTAASAGGAGTSATVAAAEPAQSTGELKMAIDGEFPATLDATQNAYQLVRL